MHLLYDILMPCLTILAIAWATYKTPRKPENGIPDGVYQVYHNGNVIYNGDDLAMAKTTYKTCEIVGEVELYTRGHHTATRRINGISSGRA